MAYAEKTTVEFERSISEIIGMLKKYGANKIALIKDEDNFQIQFFMNDRMIKFTIKFPSIDDIEDRTATGRRVNPKNKQSALKQSIRQKGRALMLVIKAKLESIESNVETFEQAFLANVVMFDGKTIHERISKDVHDEYQTGKPNMLLLGKQ